MSQNIKDIGNINGIFLFLLLGMGLNLAMPQLVFADEEDVKQKRGPLRVFIRPGAKEKPEQDVFIQAGKWVEEYSHAIEWDRVLDKDFYAGLEYGKKPADMSGEDTSWGYDAVYEKMSEYGDLKYGVEKNAVAAKYLYWDTPKGFSNPMYELIHGNDSKISGYYNYSRYGQYWLLSNMKFLKVANSKFDQTLVNMLDTLEKKRQ